MDPSQLKYLQQALQNLGPQANEAMSQMLKPYDEEQFQGLFKKAFIDPAMMNYEQQVIPSIKQSMISQNASSSGALNQALAASAQDLSTGLGTQMGQFYQGQQTNQLNALGILAQMLGMKPYENIATNRPSPFQQMSQTAMGAAGMMMPWGMGRYGGR